MNRVVPYAVGGLLLGGVIHIAIVLMVPLFATNDAWSRMAAYGADGVFHLIARPTAGAEPVTGLDPRMLQAVCRFDLSDAPIRVAGDLPGEYWSVALFDRQGRNAYSLNDRTAEQDRLDLWVLTAVQMAQLRQDPPAALETAILVEVPNELGFVVLRVFVPDDTAAAAAETALTAAQCTPAA
jgi:uncharacterized membrane protein